MSEMHLLYFFIIIIFGILSPSQMQMLDKFPMEGGQKDPKQRIIPFLPGRRDPCSEMGPVGCAQCGSWRSRLVLLGALSNAQNLSHL